MSSNSNNFGRGYEYAWMISLYDFLSQQRKTQIMKNSSYDANLKAWNSLEKNIQDIYLLSASSCIQTMIELEPNLNEIEDDVLTLEFQKDEKGIQGDVRDIVIKRKNIDWEIGLSIKHNHEAIKHSRLSNTIDFGKEWFSIPCSNEYWKTINPIFVQLTDLKQKQIKWSEINNKENKIYLPILKAFINEIKTSYRLNKSLPKKMIEYLIGTKDYYKVVSMDSKELTLIHTFNVHKTLNKPSKIQVSSIIVPVTKLPTELITIKLKKESKTTVEMYLNNGWTLSFRIHNASTVVEPSLKFDIQFIGMPVSILNIECKWK